MSISAYVRHLDLLTIAGHADKKYGVTRPHLIARLIFAAIGIDLLMRMVKDPTLISKTTPLIWAAHNLERIADRVTNICERIVFLATGAMPQVNVSKY